VNDITSLPLLERAARAELVEAITTPPLFLRAVLGEPLSQPERDTQLEQLRRDLQPWVRTP